jgi:hypothetical protein
VKFGVAKTGGWGWGRTGTGMVASSSHAPVTGQRASGLGERKGSLWNRCRCRTSNSSSNNNKTRNRNRRVEGVGLPVEVGSWTRRGRVEEDPHGNLIKMGAYAARACRLGSLARVMAGGGLAASNLGWRPQPIVSSSCAAGEGRAGETWHT